MFRTLFALLVSLAPALAAQSDGADPLPDPEHRITKGTGAPIRFVAIGDFGDGSAESVAVAALVRAQYPRFIITLGDNNYPDGAAATIDRNVGLLYHDFIEPYVGTYGAGAQFNRFFPCLGNHDWETTDAQPYVDYFDLPNNERYYTFRRGPIQFFALDSDEAEPDGIGADSVQAEWLRTNLARSEAAFKVVYLHHAPYTSGEHHGSTLESQWPFAEWGASIVLAGHEHVYERLSVTGLPYIVNGLGGADLYDFDTPLGGSQLRFNGARGALVVDVEDEYAHFRFLTIGNSVQDDFVLPRTGLAPETTELVPLDAEWKYRDTGVDPGPAWTHVGFDDAAWASGRAELGYGDGDEQTVVASGYGTPGGRYITTWFRRKFFFAHPEELEALQLRLRHDDGAVVHLNGHEVLRANMPAGPITSATLATRAVGNEAESTLHEFRLDARALSSVSLRALAPGWNVLAVEIHQSSQSSPDISFAAELVGLGGEVVLRRGAEWRYLDTGAVPAVDWTDAGFDDTQWSSGRGQLGYGEGDETTLLAAGPTTAWFRGAFSVDDAAAVKWLECRILRDDGAIVYLNGHEAARLNLPQVGVVAGTFAPFKVSGVSETRFDVTSLDPRLLVDGRNTIAVEVHQFAGSDDLSFDLELVNH